MSRPPAAPTGTVVLADGRTLGYDEVGDPDGVPVLSNHGGLLCRRDVEPAAAAMAELGVRLVSPDRPGVASSDRSPDRSTLDWADDVEQLLDALAIERVAVTGWSMGGQYAAAVARRLPDRVSALAVVAGALPLDDPSTFAQLNRMDRQLTELSRSHPAAAREAFRAMRALEGHAPDRMAALSSKGAPATDRQVWSSEARWVAEVMGEAMTHLHGMVDEFVAWARPWGFRLEEITVPTAVWQGSDDPLVPAAWADEMAARVPGARLHRLPGLGHMIGVTHRHEVVSELLELARP